MMDATVAYLLKVLLERSFYLVVANDEIGAARLVLHRDLSTPKGVELDWCLGIMGVRIDNHGSLPVTKGGGVAGVGQAGSIYRGKIDAVVFGQKD